MNEAEKIQIKKYSNRRLYDTTNSKYITLDEIAEMIREGKSVEVVDSRTGEDLTKMVLAQIILEKDKGRGNLLPMAFLQQIIQANEELIKDFFEKYFSLTFEAYLSSRRMMEEKLREMSALGALPAEMGEMFLKNLPLFGAPSIPSRDKTADKMRDELESLKKRIEELEKDLARSQGAQPEKI